MPQGKSWARSGRGALPSVACQRDEHHVSHGGPATMPKILPWLIAAHQKAIASGLVRSPLSGSI
eukprot:6164888-Pyramimonas_sp.AAC.1